MTASRKKSIPVGNLLTNKRDNESDLGGATLSRRASADDILPPYPAVRDDNRKGNPR